MFINNKFYLRKSIITTKNKEKQGEKTHFENANAGSKPAKLSLNKWDTRIWKYTTSIQFPLFLKKHSFFSTHHSFFWILHKESKTRDKKDGAWTFPTFYIYIYIYKRNSIICCPLLKRKFKKKSLIDTQKFFTMYTVFLSNKKQVTTINFFFFFFQ